MEALKKQLENKKVRYALFVMALLLLVGFGLSKIKAEKAAPAAAAEAAK